MGYTPAEIEPLALRFVADLPGLDIRLARTWIGAESGVGNNPLGVTHVVDGHTTLMTYGTRFMGIDAAASLIKASDHYAGIRASLGHSLREQALAVIASPWNEPNSPYYTRVFTAAGLLVTAPVPTGQPHIRITGPWTSYTVRAGVVVGHTARTALGTYPCTKPSNIIINDPRSPIQMCQLTAGPFKGLWVNPSGGTTKYSL